MRMNVVLPVPFSPSSTTISLSVKSPAATCRVKGVVPGDTIVLVMSG